MRTSLLLYCIYVIVSFICAREIIEHFNSAGKLIGIFDRLFVQNAEAEEFRACLNNERFSMTKGDWLDRSQLI